MRYSPSPSPLGLWPALVDRQPDLLPRVAVVATQLHALPRRVRRTLRKQWRGPLIGMALVLALGQPPARAATIAVGGPCTLVDAIQAANSDTARGGCPAGSGADTIVLPAGSRQTLTEVHNSTYGPTGLPVIRSAITIAGQGSRIVRDRRAPEFRLFAVNSTGELTLQETTVRGGSIVDGSGGGVASYGGTVTLTHSTLSGNTAEASGGGMFNDGGTVTLTTSTLAGNSASYGGGVFNSLGTVTLTTSTLSGNSARDGGGVASYGGTVTLTNSTLADNSAQSWGGGVVNFGSGTVTLTHSTLSGNSARDGGGVASYGGTVTLTNSTLSDNSAQSWGGGVVNFGSDTVTLTNSTLSGNSARDGGGVFNNLAGSLLSSIAPSPAILPATAAAAACERRHPHPHQQHPLRQYGLHAASAAPCGTPGPMTLTDSTLSGTRRRRRRHLEHGTVTLTNSTLSGNSRPLRRRVANIYDGTVTLTNSTLSGNTPVYGGGIRNDGTVTLTNSTLSGNTAGRLRPRRRRI